MPLLDAESRDWLLDRRRFCDSCKHVVTMNYCRECDEFCTDDHILGCREATHIGHRGYDRNSPVLDDGMLGHMHEARHGAYAINFGKQRKVTPPSSRPSWERPVEDTGAL